MLSRRQVLRLLALIAGGRAFAAAKPKAGGDNGIGGTGLKPADNGIGGTGFIGTIRKFGSVWVNGERIAYPSDVRIRDRRRTRRAGRDADRPGRPARRRASATAPGRPAAS